MGVMALYRLFKTDFWNLGNGVEPLIGVSTW